VFPAPHRRRETAVRVIKTSDIEARGRLQEIFRPKELRLVLGAAEMRSALVRQDERAFHQAFEKVRPWFPTAGELRLNPIGRDWTGARDVYTRLMSSLLQKARLILWQPQEPSLMPALYCPDLKTASFVMTAMGRLRVCPKCNEVFYPHADNQDYCEPAHGTAYRTARSRWNKKQRALAQGKPARISRGKAK